MATGAGKSILPINCRPGFRLKVGDNLLSSPEGCTAAIHDLFETPPMGLAGRDIAALNLLCARELPGSEKLDIPKCRAQLDRLASFVKDGTQRNLHRFRNNPDYGHCEPMWRMAHLVT